ncbi:hypothetical protein BH10PSE2_BH10PSE2_15490 [soil metagenome]
MGHLLNRLRQASPAHRVETTGEGFVIVRRDGFEQAFNDLARTAINGDDTDFVAFPVSDGGLGYERVVILPIG